MVMARWRRPVAVRAGSRRLRCAIVASTPACCNCRSSSCVCMYSDMGMYVCNAQTRARQDTHQEFVHSRRGHLITAAGILLWCVREPQGRPVAHHRRHRLGWRRLACVRVRRRVSMGGVLTTVCLPQEHKCLYMHVKPRVSTRATEVAYLALLLAGIDVALG